VALSAAEWAADSAAYWAARDKYAGWLDEMCLEVVDE
jgi:hypothetical protein